MKILKKLSIDNFYIVLLIVCILIFFYPFIVLGKIPIPADTIVGMYHPFRDVVWDEFTAGVPFKNYLITDPVRQQYVWRKLAIDQIKQGELPLWNPYSFSGTPLLANFQSAAFYPLNIVFFILPFNLAWGILVVLQPLLGGIFLYYYLRYINISGIGSFIGSIVFSFSGFSIAWLEWNTILHTLLWLPLIFLAKEKLLKKVTLKWSLILLFAEVSSFFAGHLQVLFYTLIVSNLYLLVRIIQFATKNTKQQNVLVVAIRKYLPFLFIGSIVFIVTSIQWLPTIRFILQSARDFDQANWMKEGWFIPWQNLTQFIAPDFFGNPATRNYWGVWNYAEFIGYIGILPLIFVIYALMFRVDKKTLFFGGLIFIGFIFSLPTSFAKIPYILKLPLISTSQPTRLMSIITFSLSIMTGLGVDLWIKEKRLKKTVISMVIPAVIFLTIWIFILRPELQAAQINYENILITRRNLVLPSLLFVVSFIILTGSLVLTLKNKFRNLYVLGIIIIIVIDFYRFGWKFTPFSKSEWIFPGTKIINSLNDLKDSWRILAIDRRIMPPNFSSAYQNQDVAGYDPLYLKLYGQLIAAWERNKPDITPSAFNRIVTPVNYESFFMDLLGVKYVLSINPIDSQKLNLIEREGTTFLYENKNVFPRAYLVEELISVANSQAEIEEMYRLKDNLRNIAVTSENITIHRNQLTELDKLEILEYSNNKVVIRTQSKIERLLVLTDIYYPSWKVFIDGQEEKMLKVDFTFRGVIVSQGEHLIIFKNQLL